MKKTIFLAGLVTCGSLPVRAALPLTESTFTEIIREANVVAAASKAEAPARTNELFKTPDLVRTGQASRVELTAKDHTITRVGANTVFTFAAEGRDIQLEKGGVLFHSPAGAGGGTIKHHGSSAAVLGTTGLAEVLPSDQFKVLDLEGSVKVTLRNGLSVTLKPGQMVIVSADGRKLSRVMDFNLGELASHLLLVVGFSHPLSSGPLIAAAIQEQNQAIAAGKLSDLVSFQTAGLWLDIGVRNDLAGMPWNESGLFDKPVPTTGWNPLDFPGQGPVGPNPGGPGAYLLVPPTGLPPESVLLLVNPPKATDPNFPMSH